jgi:hypothetical protein
MRFGTWYVRSLYTSGSLKTVSRELSKYKSDVVGVQESGTGWCDIIALNAHAPTEDQCDDKKNSFYEDLECLFEQFPKFYMQILLGDFTVNAGR